MGVITVTDPAGQKTTVSEDGWLRIGVGNFLGDTLLARAAIVGDAGQPVSADVNVHGTVATLVSSTPGEAITANVNATIGGSTHPLAAAVNLDVQPVHATITTGQTPIKVDLSADALALRNTTITFKLFGMLTLFTVELTQ